MPGPRRGTRALQRVFLALLIFSTAQVIWWVYDQERSAERHNADLRELYAGERRLAEHLLADGHDRSTLAARLPNLAFGADGSVTVSPEVLAALEEVRHRRIRRYLWEGGFFFSVLIGCMAVIWGTLREESLLRKRQENFIAAVTHELKSPLASLQLSVDTLRLRDPAPERRQELTSRMLGDLGRLEDMVSKILDAAALEAGRLRLGKEPVALGATVSGLLAELRERAAVARVEIAAAVDDELEIAADPVAARTVLRNLLENALRATAENGGGRISISARRELGHVLLAVTDTGVGFEPHEAARLFEKFYRPGDELRRSGRGTGLGLYIVDRFMRLEHGWVVAESAGPGRGATFTVAWPRAAKREEAT